MKKLKKVMGIGRTGRWRLPDVFFFQERSSEGEGKEPMSSHNRQRREKQVKGLPKYAPAVLDASQQALADGKMKAGQIYTIDVRHDDWCDLLTGVRERATATRR